MSEGIIRKALSGFYYVDDGTELVTCRARGKHRHAGLTPLVGDRVRFTSLEGGQGALDAPHCPGWGKSAPTSRPLQSTGCPRSCWQS